MKWKTHRVVKQQDLEKCCCFIWKSRYPDYSLMCSCKHNSNVSSLKLSLQFHIWFLMMFADLFSRIVSWSCMLFPPKYVVHVTHTHTKFVLKHDMWTEKSTTPLQHWPLRSPVASMHCSGMSSRAFPCTDASIRDMAYPIQRQLGRWVSFSNWWDMLPFLGG